MIFNNTASSFTEKQCDWENHYQRVPSYRCDGSCYYSCDCLRIISYTNRSSVVDITLQTATPQPHP